MDEEKVKLTTWEDELSDLITDEWTKGRQYVDDLDDLFDDIYSMIRGERPEKNYDWQSNVVINKAFQVIWTAVPYIAQKIFGASPVMGVVSFDKKGAWQREQILEFWHQLQGVENSEHVPYFLIVVQMLIRTTLNGMGYMKKTWTQKLVTRNGRKIPIEDHPHNIVVGNKDIVFDWELSPEKSIRQGRFVIHRTVNDLDSLDSSGLYENLDEINKHQSMENSTRNQDHAEATSKNDQDTTPSSDIYTDVEVYERVGLLPVIRKDGVWQYSVDGDKKYMVAVKAMGGKDTKDVIIRLDKSEYEEINYIDAKCYMDTERFNSVGLIEPAKDTITAMNDVFNGISDEMWKNLMSPIVINKHALWDWDTMTYAPGQRWMVAGDPSKALLPLPPSNVTRDAWQTYGLLDNETQQTSVTNSMAGAGKEKTATTNVMNAQLSASKLDFVLKMFEITCLIPSAQMDIRFAKKFAKQETLDLIVAVAAQEQGKPPEPFQFSDWEEVYKYTPVASSVKTGQIKERETQEDIQLLQMLGAMKNPKTAKIMNKILANIFRNRDMPVEADMLDEDYFEPETEAGGIDQIMKTMSGAASNDSGVPMSGAEQGVRQSTYKPRGM